MKAFIRELQNDPARAAKVGFELIVLLTLVAYLPSLSGGFTWDDNIGVYDNAFVKLPDGWWRVWWTTMTPDYFPLTANSFWLEWRLWGKQARGYHVTQIILHIITALLVWRVLRRLKVRGAWLAGLVFALHPVCVESVSWISERKNTLSLLFYLLTFLFYFRFEQESRRRWYALALVCFVLALLSKTSVVMLPVLLLLCVWWRNGKWTLPDLWRTVPFFLLSFVFGLITIWFQNHRAMADTIEIAGGLPARLVIASWALWFYLYKTLLPVGLSMIYPKWVIPYAHPLAYLPLLAYAGLVLTGWVKRDSWGRPLVVLLVHLAVALLPVLGFFDMAFMQYSFVADHFQHVALPGSVAVVIGCAVWYTERGGQTRRFAGLLAAGVLVMVLFFLTLHENWVYGDAERLWRQAVDRNPACSAAFNNLGASLMEKAKGKRLSGPVFSLEGRPDTSYRVTAGSPEYRRTEEALLELQKSVAISPNAAAYTNIGSALALQGKEDEALAFLRQAVQLNPESPDALSNLGGLLERQGHPAEALPYYREALRLRPGYDSAYFNLGNALVALNRTEEGIRYYRQALVLRQDFVEAHINLAVVLGRAGQYPEALALYERAARLRPGDANIEVNMGTIYLRMKRFAEAEDSFRRAVVLDSENAGAFLNLGIALSLRGEFAAANDCLATALKLDPEEADAQKVLGLNLCQMGKLAEARQHLEAALALKPNSLEYLLTLGQFLLQSGGGDVRQAAEAEALARKAAGLPGGRSLGVAMVLMQALADQKRFVEAATAARDAAELASQAGDPRLAADLQERAQKWAPGSP